MKTKILFDTTHPNNPNIHYALKKVVVSRSIMNIYHYMYYGKNEAGSYNVEVSSMDIEIDEIEDIL